MDIYICLAIILINNIYTSNIFYFGSATLSKIQAKQDNHQMIYIFSSFGREFVHGLSGD